MPKLVLRHFNKHKRINYKKVHLAINPISIKISVTILKVPYFKRKHTKETKEDIRLPDNTIMANIKLEMNKFLTQ